jgi:hypothetical protein
VVDEDEVPYESGPDETLTPDEASAWSAIERSLRRDLRLPRIERRTRRADRATVLAAIGLLVGLGVAIMASVAPVALTALAMVLAGSCVGTIFVRGMASVIAVGSFGVVHQADRPGRGPRRPR